jgi:hypothetical protein
MMSYFEYLGGGFLDLPSVPPKELPNRLNLSEVLLVSTLFLGLCLTVVGASSWDLRFMDDNDTGVDVSFEFRLEESFSFSLLFGELGSRDRPKTCLRLLFLELVVRGVSFCI